MSIRIEQALADHRAVQRLVGLLGDPAPSPIAAELDVAVAFAWAHWHLGPLLARNLAGALATCDRTLPVVGAFGDRVIALKHYAEIQTNLALRITRALEANGIQYALLKGTASRFLLYASPTDRLGLDLDIAVRPQDVYRAEEVVLALGFERAQWDSKTMQFVTADPVFRAIMETQHHELGFLTRMQEARLTEGDASAVRRALPLYARWFEVDGALVTSVTVDLHHQPSFGVPVDAVLERAATLDIRGTAVRLSPLSSLVFLLIHKTYWEAVHRTAFSLHHYADLCRAVPRLDHEEASECAEQLLRHTGAAEAGEVLWRLSHHFGVEVPDPLNQLKEKRGVTGHWETLMQTMFQRLRRAPQ